MVHLFVLKTSGLYIFCAAFSKFFLRAIWAAIYLHVKTFCDRTYHAEIIDISVRAVR